MISPICCATHGISLCVFPLFASNFIFCRNYLLCALGFGSVPLKRFYGCQLQCTTRFTHSRPFPLVIYLGFLLWVGCVRTQALHLHATQARCSDFLQKILVWPGPGIHCPYLCGSLHCWEMFSWPGLFLPVHWVCHLHFCLLGIFILVTSVKCS